MNEWIDDWIYPFILQTVEFQFKAFEKKYISLIVLIEKEIRQNHCQTICRCRGTFAHDYVWSINFITMAMRNDKKARRI